MSNFPGSVRATLQNSTPIDVALVDLLGDQVPGFDVSRPANAALTTLAYALSSQVLLPANPARRQFMVHNATSKAVNLAFAATASLSVLTVVVSSGGDYVSDQDSYTGVVSVFWLQAPAAGPVLHITEITT